MKHKSKFFIIVIFSMLSMLWTNTVWADPANGFAINQNLVSSTLNEDGGWQSSAGTVQMTDDGLKVDSSKNFTIYQEISLPDDTMSYTAAFSASQRNKSGVLSKEDQGSIEIIFVRADGTEQDTAVKLTAASYEEWYTRAQEFVIPSGTSTVRIELNGIYRKLSILNKGATIDTYFKDIYFGVSSMTYAQGDGSAENPFLIHSAYALQFMAQNINPTAYYALQNDIDMTGVEWTPIGNKLPKDHFNYNGFSINGLSTGFFGYTVNFVTNGGTDVASISDISAGTSLTDIATTTREGYTFNGWYTDTALSQPISTVNGDMTVYAGWEIQQYTVNFVVNRGDMATDPIGVNYNSVATLPTLECHGFTFGGWFTNIELTQPFNAATPITSDITLYAKWEDNGIGMLVDIGNGDITFEKLDDGHFFITQNGKTSVDYENSTIISITGSTSENQIIIKEGINISICLTSLQITTTSKNPISIMPNATVKILTKSSVRLQTSEKLSGIYLSKGSYLYLDGEMTIDAKKDMAIGVNGEQNGQGVFIVQNGRIQTKTNKGVQILIRVLAVIAIIIMLLIIYMWVSVQLRKKGLLQRFKSKGNNSTDGSTATIASVRTKKSLAKTKQSLESENVAEDKLNSSKKDISNVMANTRKAYDIPQSTQAHKNNVENQNENIINEPVEEKIPKNRVNLSGTKLTDDNPNTDNRHLYGEKMDVDAEKLSSSTEYQPYEIQKNIDGSNYNKNDNTIDMYAEADENKTTSENIAEENLYTISNDDNSNLDTSVNAQDMANSYVFPDTTNFDSYQVSDSEDTTDVYISSNTDDNKMETLDINVTAQPFLGEMQETIDTLINTDNSYDPDDSHISHVVAKHIDLNDVSQLNELDESESNDKEESSNNKDNQEFNGYTNDYIENYVKEYGKRFTRTFTKDEMGNFVEIPKGNTKNDNDIAKENTILNDSNKNIEDEDDWYKQQLLDDEKEREGEETDDKEGNVQTINELIDDFVNDPEEEKWFREQVETDDSGAAEDFYGNWQYSNMENENSDLMNIQTHKRNKDK